ncbi:hypothetical protein BJ170DRAFT_463398 [Xylariales sp. AK1849]|nr:hypothetical protein BJ170DRAFT_463398 [Xylariales sp. AK1849]
MNFEGGYAKLDPASDTLSPLPEFHRTGLVAVGSAALISLISTTVLFAFLTYKLVKWKLNRCHQDGGQRDEANDVSLSLPDRISYPTKASSSPLEGSETKDDVPQPPVTKEQRRNPFPILIYNLLLAEMHTSLGYTLNISWVLRDGIHVGTNTCWAQGWFNNFGVLASSIFFVTISANTYLAVVWGWRPPQRTTHITIALCWILALILNSAGIVQTGNGRAEGGWFVRADAWCWTNAKYAVARLWGEWAWILTSMLTTIFLYILVFWNLYRDSRSSRHLPCKSSTRGEGHQPSGHHPAFLAYPFIYIACTTPLAVVRLVSIRGGTPGTTLYCIAGLILSTNGRWNTMLWSTTLGWISLCLYGLHCGVATATRS